MIYTSHHHPLSDHRSPWLGATGNIVKACLVIGVCYLGLKSIELCLDMHDYLFFLKHSTLAYFGAFVSCYAVLVVCVGAVALILYLGHNSEDTDGWD